MCALIDAKTFKTIHHELGHNQYHIQYKDLASVFQDGANPGERNRRV